MTGGTQIGADWIDVTAGLVVVVSALFGYGRGLVRELLGLGSWIGAAVLATRLTGPVLQAIAPSITNPLVAGVVAFALPFIGLLVVFTLVTQAIGRVVRDSALGGLNSMLGLLFGGVRGYGVLVAAYLVAGLVAAPAEWPLAVQTARLLPLVSQGAFFLQRVLPISMKPSLAQLMQTRHDAPI
ncbi:Colicin V production protein [Gluconacetobacter diazotrophicus PA1 5]|uniref:CvpA family protein n=2 Tax=Gluconacetobacter diazotrophicus TaxID=33996 RepID=A0A7W4I898_GLUDI|nr:CvpA family protein [Gluconacetobacter diazotrophicus]ACI52610.1 Colicin V production protein [Gluconacetobacter diazotrophicus PA1 5]MBB2158136.1 CvpA family protein [Gluconacetobacter diazotrophicus]TWB06017.1 membrane protein required for colicin V production [Gluconacetobacter diazotrophicus]CAP57447.1 putative colicin V [Gluconacetobacter diazotrophicus PA1 5]